ncbi:MAG: biotin synthase BioB [Chlamydiales bacterium 38-26]|nr:biotin synthase BioB [Chlamydiales bacterium]OJV08162.1 MAG: biotin synthase BioB [Chlamydiales bacterium 38-26]
MVIVRNDWTIEEIGTMYRLPLLALISQAHQMHIQFHLPHEVQVCTLISVKTGGCPEDCKYCAQSSRNQTFVKALPIMKYAEVIAEAKRAKARGSTRICLGAAWREIRENKPFEEILEMIKGIKALNMEVCCTLGMLTSTQAERLKEAGLYAYNHNLDTSESFYPNITSTRSYQERLHTLDIVQETELSLCCGGIMGLGESIEDRLQLLHTLSTRKVHPESVPINRLEPIPGTPLEKQLPVSIWEFVRIIALTRILMPKAMIRLSAGRLSLSFIEQTLCFIAGANSIFAGEKLLTVANQSIDKDAELFQLLGIQKQPAFVKDQA